MSAGEIRRVLVIGAGTMGTQIAVQCAAHGFEVALHDSAPAAVADAPRRLAAAADEMLASGFLDTDARPSTLARIAVEADLAAAASGADLVSESIVEDPKAKGALFARLHDLCPPGTIFTTNSSSLVPSQIASKTGRPARFAALHFHQPTWSARIVDVMGHPGTDPGVLDRVEGFARRIGQIPVRAEKEHHGYVFNAMYNALNREAITLAASGVASVEDVDRSWMGIMKMPIGPFGILDMVGIDTAWHITDYWAKRLIWDRQMRRNADWLRAYVDRGALGTKTGRGFYAYPDPAYARPGFVDGVPPQGD
jgi:3-hydroxybutyryl-CoA dehydrogenase